MAMQEVHADEVKDAADELQKLSKELKELVKDMKDSGLDPFEANAGTFFHTVDKAREYTIKLKVQFSKVKLMSAIDS
jgi:predicted phage-related endonuclease